ncbi:MFS transporter [Fodinicola acaciae]|uniref:MFS transporter n=1 Tax=Fodinicola acaciae TaxID=2681555 RepID=UPI0013D0F352|nr:MFS transporter [Fodinicola acaciae]
MSTPHPRRWWVLGVLCLTLLVLSVDAMILNLAIPPLMRDLGATPADIQWILDAYVLVFAGSLITAGGMSDRYGRRRMLVVGLAVLGAASLFAAFAGAPWLLIACRALMGLGAAFAMPSTLSILMTVFQGPELRKAMSAWSMVALVGVVAGPTAGGFLLAHFAWNSVFLINVPLAVGAIVAALLVVPESRAPARPADPVGAVLSVIGLASLVWAIISLPHTGFSTPVVGAFPVAAIALTAFVTWEVRTPHPMLPLSIFRNRQFSGASLSVVLLMFASGALMLGLTQYLQLVLGYGPMLAGLALLPYALSAALCNTLGVTLGKRLSNRTLAVTGLAVIAVAFAILVLVDGVFLLVTALVVMGLGAGLATPAVYATLMSAIPQEHAGVGSAVNDTIQQSGLALSVAGLGSLLTAGYSAALPVGAPAAAHASLAEALKLAAETHSPALAQSAREAFVTAMSLVSIAGVICSIAGAVLAFLVLRTKTAPVVEKEKVLA